MKNSYAVYYKCTNCLQWCFISCGFGIEMRNRLSCPNCGTKNLFKTNEEYKAQTRIFWGTYVPETYTVEWN